MDELWADYRRYVELEQGHRHETYQSHRRTVLAFLHHAAKPLDQVDVADLERYCHRPGLALASTAQYISHLRLFFAWAAEEGRLAADPFRRVRVPAAYPPAPREVSLADVAKLLRFLTPRPRLHTAVWLCYGAGLRACEVAWARRERVDLDFDRPSIEVFGKGRRWRTIPLAPVVADVLAGWISQDWPGGSGPLIPSERDPLAHISPSWISRQLADAMHAVGIAESGHALRHTFAKRVLAECDDLRAVQQLMGHVQLATTERYVKGLSAQTRRAVARLPDPRHATVTRLRPVAGG